MEQAETLKRHEGPVTVFVPHYAMSGGTLIALAADQIIMDPNAVLGPVDPQLGDPQHGYFPAASILAALEQPNPNREDSTLIMGDVARKAIRQVHKAVHELVRDKMSEERAEAFARQMSEGHWTHDYPIAVEEAKSLGLPISEEMPTEIYELMQLYPQPAQRRPSVEFIPAPYRPTPLPPKGSIMIWRRLRAPLALAALVSAIAVSTALADVPAEAVLPVPYRSQADGSIWAGSNCGPTAIAMVLEAYGTKVPTKKLRDRANQLLGIADPNTGTRVQDLARVVQEHGLSVTGPYEGNWFRRWTLGEARAELQSGRPMVIQVYYPLLPNHRNNPVVTDHYIVLVGTSGEDFIFNDSADRDSPGYRQRMTAEELTLAWKASQFPFAGFSIGLGSMGQPLAATATPTPTATATPSPTSTATPSPPPRAAPLRPPGPGSPAPPTPPVPGPPCLLDSGPALPGPAPTAPAAQSGPNKVAPVGRTSSQPPRFSATTAMDPSPSASTRAASSPASQAGSSQDRRFPQRRAEAGLPAQAPLQRPPTSGVQAMARPRPYCHAASTGSPSGDTSTTSACSLAVVATYPSRGGTAPSPPAGGGRPRRPPVGALHVLTATASASSSAASSNLCSATLHHS